MAAVCLAIAASHGARAQQDSPERELAALSRALSDSGAPEAYNRLEGFAGRNKSSEWGNRARLALGYYDLNQKRHPQASAHLEAAERDAVLSEYALLWHAQALRALGRHPEALVKLETLRKDYPQSVNAEAAVAVLAESAITSAQAQRAMAALDGYPRTESRPGLLLLRAQARERLNQPDGAAADYLALYYQHALSDEARQAQLKIRELRASLGEKFPAVPLETRVGRAKALYDARRWNDARADYTALVDELQGAAQQDARLRVAICRANTGAGPAPLSSLTLTDAEFDAERLYTLSQVYRRGNNEAAMLAAIEQAVKQYPKSRWTEEALFAGGNYFRVNLERARAAEYYRRSFEGFPNGSNTMVAHWRVAWEMYLEREPEAVTLMEDHLRRFPGSPFTENALYWLGRAVERAGNVPHARTFYQKNVERFPNSYFGMQSAARLQEIGAQGPRNESEVLALIPQAAAPRAHDAPIPSAAAGAWQRAEALSMLALDAQAEAELRAAYARTRSPRLLVETARAAQRAGRYIPSITAARQVVPQLEQRPVETVPEEIWKLVYPLPYGDELASRARDKKLDPTIVAGLIRQESVFQRDAVSRAGAVGLMQVLPSTGRGLARQLRLPYSRGRLFNADYNLRLGTHYLSALVGRYGQWEKALAAYNAGEHRVNLWQTKREFAEPAEFVESIPFTETREYVQIVMRNAEIYRRLYGLGGSTD